MGKSEILMLLAGVALSIMLAMIAIPMFSSGSDMADRQQVQQELMAINSAIPLIKALEGDGEGKISNDSIQRHMEGFALVTADPDDGIKGDKKHLATFDITDNFKDDGSGTNTITVTVTPVADSGVVLNKLSRLDNICTNAAGVPEHSVNASGVLTCTMKR